MRPGEPFTPAKLYEETKGKVYPPAILAGQKGVKDKLKVLYWRLYLHFGKNPTAWPGVDTLAAEVGRAQRHVRDDLHDLETRGLIRIIRRSIGARRRGSQYQALWHPLFDERHTGIRTWAAAWATSCSS